MRCLFWLTRVWDQSVAVPLCFSSLFHSQSHLHFPFRSLGFWPAATVPTTNPRLSSLEDHYSLILCGAVCQVLVQNRPDFPNRVLLVASLKYPPLCVGLDNAPPTCALSPGFSTSQSGLTTGGSIRLSVPIRIWLSYRLHVLVHWAVERSVDKPPSAFPVHSLFICMLH